MTSVLGRRLTHAEVAEAIPFDRALTTNKVCDWLIEIHQLDPRRYRVLAATVLNRLYDLEAEGALISDEGRPVRWAQNELEV